MYSYSLLELMIRLKITPKVFNMLVSVAKFAVSFTQVGYGNV